MDPVREPEIGDVPERRGAQPAELRQGGGQAWARGRAGSHLKHARPRFRSSPLRGFIACTNGRRGPGNSTRRLRLTPLAAPREVERVPYRGIPRARAALLRQPVFEYRGQTPCASATDVTPARARGLLAAKACGVVAVGMESRPGLERSSWRRRHPLRRFRRVGRPAAHPAPATRIGVEFGARLEVSGGSLEKRKTTPELTQGRLSRDGRQRTAGHRARGCLVARAHRRRGRLERRAAPRPTTEGGIVHEHPGAFA